MMKNRIKDNDAPPQRLYLGYSVQAPGFGARVTTVITQAAGHLLRCPNKLLSLACFLASLLPCLLLSDDAFCVPPALEASCLEDG